MAGKEVTTPEITGSEEIINCTPCSEAERTTVTVECKSHDGHFIDRYCKNHDEVCCKICVTVKHRSCKDVNKIETLAEGIKESQEFSDLKSSLEKFITSANQEKAYRKYHLKDMTEEKEKILADIDKYEERLIQRIKVLANTSRENFQKAHAKHQDAVKADIKELDTVMSEVTKRFNHINGAAFHEVEAFITMKNCQIFSKEVQKVETDLSKHWLQTSLSYTFNDEVIPKIITAFGNVVEETKESPVFHLQLKQAVDITCQTDSNNCSINGICQLPDNTVIITDANNAKLKRLGDNLEVKDYIDLNDTPECMCVTKPQEVAIVLRERNVVQFVTIDENMTLETSFPIEEGKRTKIDCDPTENTVYVCYMVECEKPEKKMTPLPFFYNMTHKYHVIVYSKKGERLSIYNNEEDESRQFCEPLKILISLDTFDLIYADKDIYTFSKTDMKQKPTRKGCGLLYIGVRYEYLCMLSAQNMIFGNKNGEMSLKSSHGTQQKTLKLAESSPVLAVLFNKQNSTLIVVGESSQIKEYKIGLKILYLLKEIF